MKLIVNLTLFTLGLCFSVTSSYAKTLMLEQVLQRVIDHYPSIKSASIQVEKAKQEELKVGSQLGWQLGAEVGISHNVSVFGISSDKFDASGSLSRSMESGSTLGISATLSHEDSELSFSPTIPNPATISRVDLTYREHLAQGSNNPAFKEGLVGADAGVVIAMAEKEKLYDVLAENVIELYLAATTTQARIANIENAVSRTRRLQKYIKNRQQLGITEEKDTLQVNAQLISQQAELSGLKVLWQKQRISLNRLMGVSADAEFNSVVSTVSRKKVEFDNVYSKTKQHSPALKSVDGKLLLADSSIRLMRDADEDNLDLVLFIGARNQLGDSASGNINDSDLVGGARLEFSQSQDKSGIDAQLYQAHLDRSSAIEDKRQILEDLNYDVASLLAEIDAGYDALTLYRSSVNSEDKKLKEAEQRYKTGRADTDQLIQFESQLSLAELSLELQKIELARRLLMLDLKQGEIWNRIEMHEMNNFISDETS